MVKMGIEISGEKYVGVMKLLWALCFFVFANQVECITQDQTSCTCKRTFEPVCGTDGNTYNSLCKLLCASYDDPDLRLAYNGTCCPKPYCPPVASPLCDNLGQTHDNECMFRYSFCIMRKTASVFLTVVKKGPCTVDESGKEVCSPSCSKDYDPICDLNGKTHSNLCMFNYERCMGREIGSDKGPLIMAYKGHCRSDGSTTTVASTDSEVAMDQATTTIAQTEAPMADTTTSLKNTKRVTTAESTTVIAEDYSTTEPTTESQTLSISTSTETELAERTAASTPVPEPEPEASTISAADTQVETTSTISESATTSTEASEAEITTEMLVSTSELEIQASTESIPEPETTTERESASTESMTENTESMTENTESMTENIAQKSTLPVSKNPMVSTVQESSTSEANREPDLAGFIDEYFEEKLAPEPRRQWPAESIDDYYTAEPVKSTTERICSPDDCPNDYDPICDYEGMTHLNLCMFEYRICLARKLGIKGPFIIVHRGPCGEQGETAADTAVGNSDNSDAVRDVSIDSISTIAPENGAATETVMEVFEEKSNVNEYSEQDETTEELTTEKRATESDNTMEFTESKMESTEQQTTKLQESEKSTIIAGAQQDVTTQKPDVGTTVAPAETDTVTSGEIDTVTSGEIDTVTSGEIDTVTGGEIDTVTATEIDTVTSGEIDTVTSGEIDTVTSGERDTVTAEEIDTVTTEEIDTVTTEEIDTVTAAKQKDAPYILSNDSPAVNVRCSAALCTKKSDPVCDNLNRTHRNFCIFEYLNCETVKMGKPQLSIQFAGACPSTVTIATEASLDNGTATTTEKNSAEAESSEKNSKATNLEATELSEATAETTVNFEVTSSSYSTKFDFDMCPESCADTQTLPFMICDNKNNTHWNLCFFNKANCENWRNEGEELVLVHFGPCDAYSVVFSIEEEECPEICTEDSFLICDNENRTHSNLCQYQAVNCARRHNDENRLMIKHFGECTLRAEFQKTLDAEPQRIERVGLIKQASKIFEVEVECPAPICDNKDRPVCDGDGRTHKNLCVFNYARCVERQRGVILTLAYEGSCGEPEGCLNVAECSTNYEPICGTDFQTYWNKCILLQQQCKQIAAVGVASLDVLFEGECQLCFKACEPLDPTNATDSDFVCDNLGMTHAVCEFDIAACVFQRKFGKNLTVVSEGRCCPKSEECGSLLAPVCDSFGNTHESICKFEVAKCIAEKSGESHLEIIANGPCEIESLKISEQAAHNDLSGETGCLDACAAVYEPVCGSDGKTYPNMCYLKSFACTEDGESSADLTVAYEGECCNMVCSKEWNPVCDSDGFTHLNLCEFGKSRCIAQRRLGKELNIVAYRACSSSDCERNCTQEYNPVCGSDGKTYANGCLLEKSICFAEISGYSLSLDYAGPCCQQVDCPYTYSPVCDTKGVTHVNKCVFSAAKCVAARKNNEQIDILYEAPCCDQPCTEEYEPVCDGRETHINICKFRVAQCNAQHQGAEISVEYNGECCERKVCEQSVVACDSEGQTHGNMCDLELKQCLATRLYGRNITVAHMGECCIKRQCPDIYDPVCDSLGKIHKSECDFQNAACIFEKIYNRTLTMEYEGLCCQKACEQDWDPVCDQHGKMYKNKCLFEIEACESDKRDHRMLLVTPCSPRRTARVLRHKVL